MLHVGVELTDFIPGELQHELVVVVLPVLQFGNDPRALLLQRPAQCRRFPFAPSGEPLLGDKRELIRARFELSAKLLDVARRTVEKASLDASFGALSRLVNASSRMASVRVSASRA